MSKHLLSATAATMLAVTLAACGGGGSSGSADSSTTAAASTATASGTGSSTALTSTKEVASGAVTGFGSVIVEGVRYDDSAARVQIEDDSASPRSVSSAAIRLGMQVSVASDDGATAKSVTASAEVIGRITSLAADGFVVAGQTVKVSTDAASPTVFEGVTGLAGLQVNDRVEVHGQRDASNNIVATRIERKDATASAIVRIVGPVANVDNTAKSFSLGGLTVTWTTTTRLLPAGTTLANGQRVAVWSDAAIVGNTLAAKSIVVRASDTSSDGTARVGGFVRALDFAAKTFKVDNVDVDATAASFVNGTASDLANGRRVRVRGSFVGGVLKATEVRFVKSQGDAVAQVTGAITDFVSSASFKVRGVPIDASGADVVFSNGTAATLGNGVVVRIEGPVVGDVVKPTQVEFRSTTVSLRPGSTRSETSVDGIVTEVAAGGASFVLNGTTVTVGTTTVVQGSLTNLRSGAHVEVEGTVVNGVLVASKIEIKTQEDSSVARVRGNVTDYVSASDFRVAGQKVDASSATFVNGAATDLANGRIVEAKGTVTAGVLVATQVGFR